MFHKFLAFVLFISLAFAIQNPTNWWAGSSAARGEQQQVANFAAFNVTSGHWKVVLPPGIPPAQINGVVRVGTGLLAFGSFTSIGSGASAAGLAYYDGEVWTVPEGVGLYTYTPSTLPRYAVPSTVSSAVAAVVIGNDVYLYGPFNQVGLTRGGVAGFAKLTWSQGGIFTVGTVGNGYYQSGPSGCASFCPSDSQPSGGSYKLMSYAVNNVNTFVLRVDGDLYTFSPNFASWTRITSSNGARNLLGNVKDFDINGNTIYVVGKFENLADADPTRAYLHIAMTSDAGNTWSTVSNPQPLPVANYGDVPTVTDINGNTLSSIGLTAIAVESPTSIYVAGGYRVSENLFNQSNLATQMQMRVIRISGTTATLVSERFGVSSAAAYGTYPQFLSQGNFINRLMLHSTGLYAFGPFELYREVSNAGVRFTTRYTTVMKGAARFSNNEWTQAFGGWLTTSASGDVSSTGMYSAWNTNGDVAYFMGSAASSYNLVSGSLYAYGGEKDRKQNNRWNVILGNQRFTSASSYSEGPGISEGFVRTLHNTKNGETVIFGGRFDYIGDQRIAGVGWYRYSSGEVEAVGAGLYQVNSVASFGADNFQNNRYGGDVYDIEERGDYLYAGGRFNRNNTGNYVYNVAQVRFREYNAGWQQIDGGCNDLVRDLLVVGDRLYITGDFTYCGLITDTTKGPTRGRVAASHIAVIDVTEKNPSWRNLGVGLSGNGYAMAWRKGYLYVGGAFSQAGGLDYTSGIARWRNDHWEDVVEKCRTDCNNPHSLRPYVTTRIVANCYNLRELDGRLYCVESSKNLAHWDGTYWYRSVGVSTNDYTELSNTLIQRNGTEGGLVLFSSTASSDSYTSNGANLATLDEKYTQLHPTYGGFSQTPNAMSNANSLVASLFLIAILFVSYLF